MDSMNQLTTQDLLLRMARLERQSRRFRRGAVLMSIVVAAFAAVGFRAGPMLQNDVITARRLVLVDSRGSPAARIGWEDGSLRLEIPSQQVDTLRSPDSASVVGTISRPQHLGAELLLRTGSSGPSLILADASGHEVLRLSNDAVRRVGW